MGSNELLDLKFSNFKKVLNREEGAYIPTASYGNTATIAWAGKTTVEVLEDPEAYVKALTSVFDVMWTDVNLLFGAVFTYIMQRYLPSVENRIGPDGTTMEHVALCPMKADEYDQLIADPMKYVTNVILPRKYPELFKDREYDKRALKGFAEERIYILIQLGMLTEKTLEEKYGIKSILNMQDRVDVPMDALFDYFRGFRGALTDLRRQPENVKAAIDKIWDVRCAPKMAQPYTTPFPYSWQPPHIPCYLSPKQFEEYYWVHEKPMIERIVNGGGKLYFFMEGRFEKIWHYFRELPKDSVILHVDDDDIIKAKKEIGDHQIIAGGLKLADTRMRSFDQIKDQVKRVVDECGPGGGFIYATDKAWLAPGDMNQTLIDAYNFVHEYSSK